MVGGEVRSVVGLGRRSVSWRGDYVKIRVLNSGGDQAIGNREERISQGMGIDHYKWFYHMERMDEVRLPRRIYRVELDSLSRNEMD